LASTALAAAATLLSARFNIREPGTILEGTPALVVALGGLVVEAVRRFLRLRYTSFVITRDRVYVITSMFTTNTRSVPISRLSAVHVRQGPFGRWFGYWSATLASYGSEDKSIAMPAIRDGRGLLQEASAGMRRGANAAWLTRGD
jgi:membrane protein YdbS with pleckstrin-like domain